MINDKKDRIIEIEYLRFIFAFLIIGYHFYSYYLKNMELPNYFSRAYLADEFFFLISGYFLAYDAMNQKKDSGIWTFENIKKRIKKIAVPYYLTWCICFMGRTLVVPDIGSFSDRLINSTYELLFLDMFGFKGEYSNVVSWFFSALIICIAIIGPFLHKYKKKYFLIIAPLIAFGLYSFLSQNYDFLYGPHTYLKIFPVCKGLVRSFAGINLGIFVYGITQTNEKKPSSKQIITYKIIEILLWIGIMVYMIFPFQDNKVVTSVQFDYIITIIIAIALALLFKSGNISKSTNNTVKKLSSRLGKLSMYMFLSQPILYSFHQAFTKADSNVIVLLCIYFIGTVILAIIEEKIDLKLHNLIH